MLEKIFILTLVVWTIHCLFWDGMILGFVSRWLSYKIPLWAQKIVYACAMCMTPYYGSALYWLYWGDSWQEMLKIIACSIGLSAMIITLAPIQPPGKKEDNE